MTLERTPGPLREAVSVVLLTHDCAAWVTPTLEHLSALGVPLVVVDNGSHDGTPELVDTWPGIDLVRLPVNIGAAARNVGAARVSTPYVAFCDDDEWYEPDGLQRAVDVLDGYPQLALVNARILVGEEQRLDPVSEEMSASPLQPSGDAPGAVLLGFMAGAVIVRREAYEQVGGYDPRFFIGGEEETLALPLAKAGWQMRYLPEVVVQHRPSTVNAPHLRHFGVRNTIVTAWLHRPVRSAASWTWFIIRTTPSRRTLARGLAMAVRCLPWILAERDPVDERLERALRLLEERRRGATPGRGRHADSVW